MMTGMTQCLFIKVNVSGLRNNMTQIHVQAISIDHIRDRIFYRSEEIQRQDMQKEVDSDVGITNVCLLASHGFDRFCQDL